MKKSKEIRELNRIIKKQNKQLALELARNEDMEARKTSDQEKRKSWFKRLTVLQRVLLFIIPLATFGYFIYDRYGKSDYKKFEEENTLQGDVKSPLISESASADTGKGSPENHYKIFQRQLDFDTYSYSFPIIRGVYIKNLSKMAGLIFKVGGNFVNISVAKLYRGVDNFQAEGINSNCDSVNLVLLAHDDRLYVSTKFIDLANQEMGEMQFNHWKIYKRQFLDYYCTDTSFEIIDHQGFVAFSMSFNSVGEAVPTYKDNAPMPFVSLKGYLNNPVNIYVLQENGSGYPCIYKSDPDWRQKAEKKIYDIKRTVTSRCE